MNREKNREQLEKVPYIPILDLAICFYYAFDEAGVDNGMIPIYRSHLDNWKVTDRDLLEIAVKIPPDCFPVRPFPWRMCWETHCRNFRRKSGGNF